MTNVADIKAKPATISSERLAYLASEYAKLPSHQNTISVAAGEVAAIASELLSNRSHAAAEATDALREAERFMEYFAGETENVFVGPGTPKSCLAQIRAALKD